MAFWRRNRGQESSQSQPEFEDSESGEEVQDEEETPLSASVDRPGIADKVKFWEEQDRINKELIPRVLKQHELLTAHIANHEEARAQTAALDSRIGALDESYKRDRAELDSHIDDLNESHKRYRAEMEERMATEIRSVKRQALLISLACLGVAALAVVLALVV